MPVWHVGNQVYAGLPTQPISSSPKSEARLLLAPLPHVTEYGLWKRRI